MSDKIFDKDIARVAARRAIDEVVARLRRVGTMGEAYRQLGDSAREQMLAEWIDAVQDAILAEQSRQLGEPPPEDPKAAPAVRIPPALAAMMRKAQDGSP